ADAKTVIALWVAMTYVIDAFRVCGHLYVTAPEPGCGKSLLLEVLSAIVRNGRMARSITSSSLFRMIGLDCPTLFIDEVDSIYRRGKTSESRDELRTILCQGRSKSGPLAPGEKWTTGELDTPGQG
ncbi:MAG: hypothetical protein ACXVHQ_36610, partial [Solirubrobacteraceae bacterium]